MGFLYSELFWRRIVFFDYICKGRAFWPRPLFYPVMTRFYYRIIAPALLIIAAACSGPKENNTPEVLKINPVKFDSEPGTAHSVQFKVTCDKSFKHSLEDCSWAEVSGVEERPNGLTLINIALQENTADASRSVELTIKAGSKSVSAKITQLSVSQLIPVKEITLVNMQSTPVNIKLPEDWTLSCVDTEGHETDWFSADAASGVAGVGKTVNFRALSVNLGDAPREGAAVFSMGKLKLQIRVTQAVSDVLGSVPGIFNYDGAGAAISYDPLQNQISMRRFADGTSDWRMISPGRNTFIILHGLPSEFKEGDDLTFGLYQNWTTTMEYSQEVSATVYKVEDGMVWLIAGEVCYVIKL